MLTVVKTLNKFKENNLYIPFASKHVTNDNVLLQFNQQSVRGH